MREKYVELQIFIFLGFRSSASVRKSIIFENCRLLKIGTRSKTQKNGNLDFCVFFPDKESLKVTVFFYQKRIEAKLEVEISRLGLAFRRSSGRIALHSE